MLRDDTFEENISRRNKMLLKFFTLHNYDVRLVGDLKKPNVILNDLVVLSCYVMNFDLHFTKAPFSCEIVKSFKLKEDSDISCLELQEAIELGTHKPIYKVIHAQSRLLLVGFNYIDRENSAGRYPIFGKHHPKVYFDKEYAIKQVEELNGAGYTLNVI